MKRPKLTTVELVVVWMSPLCAVAAILCGVYELWGWAILAALGAIWFEVSL